MVWCPLCEKKFQDRRGLHGHFRFVHGIEYGSGKPAKKTILTDAIERSIKRHGEGKRIVKGIEDKESKMKAKGVGFRNIGGKPTHEEGKRIVKEMESREDDRRGKIKRWVSWE